MTQAPGPAEERGDAVLVGAGGGGEERARETDRRGPAQFVPVWLAVLAVVLLLAVAGVGGYAARGLLREPTPRSAEELEVVRLREKLAGAPGDVGTRLQLAFAYQRAYRFDDALETYGEVLEQAPGDTAANYNRGVIYREIGRPEAAEEALWDVLEVQEDHTLAAKALGELYASRQEYRSLVEAVRPAAEARPQMADLQYLMGLAYENLGRADWAEARYRLALKYVPDMKEAREGLKRVETAE
ncbi:MAG: tetratricopeptide repeat protein [Coriobacteriia bacterium]|nr:tetratricopeptide repeat protein [Coriobacteriia bacterium]